MFFAAVFLLMIFVENKNQIVLRVKITPNANATAIKGVFRDADGSDFLKISVVSVPEKGKANKELIGFLSKELQIAKSQIEIVSGETTHLKKLNLGNVSDEVKQKLQQWSEL